MMALTDLAGSSCPPGRGYRTRPPPRISSSWRTSRHSAQCVSVCTGCSHWLPLVGWRRWLWLSLKRHQPDSQTASTLRINTNRGHTQHWHTGTLALAHSSTPCSTVPGESGMGHNNRFVPHSALYTSNGAAISHRNKLY